MQITNNREWLCRDHATLGIQTNPGLVQKNALQKADHWAPSKAKSYTITSLVHTDYHGRPQADQSVETGYATITVVYFTTIKEGEHRVVEGRSG